MAVSWWRAVGVRGGRKSGTEVGARGGGGGGGGAHLGGAVLLRQLDVLEHGLEVLHGLLGGRVELEEVLVRVRVKGRVRVRLEVVR